MQDISVLYLSRVSLIPGIGHRAHTHDYWHFVLTPNARKVDEAGKESFGVGVKCWAPGEVALPYVCGFSDITNYNVMFLVHDKNLYSKLEALPFEDLTPEELHIPVILDMVQKVHDLNPGQEFVDYAFGYYLQLILTSYQSREKKLGQSVGLAEKAIAFIGENYMRQIRLEDIAEHIGRTTAYTSHLVKSATGMTIMEHLREARIKNACRKLAYSDIAIDEIIPSCGFISESYFHKVFREKIGTTPNRYRTSHAVNDTFYQGEDAALDVPYDQNKQLFTYIPGARKCIDWKTPREYFNQDVK